MELIGLIKRQDTNQNNELSRKYTLFENLIQELKKMGLIIGMAALLLNYQQIRKASANRPFHLISRDWTYAQMTDELRT